LNLFIGKVVLIAGEIAIRISNNQSYVIIYGNRKYFKRNNKDEAMHTVLITGANRGLGLEMAKQYSADGWQVIACCREPAKADALQKLKNNIQILQLDVSDAHNIKDLSRHIGNQPIDILLNNAGVLPEDQAFGTVQAELLIDTFKVNTVAPFILAEVLLKNIAASDLKIIANMSSVMGSIAENSSGGHYAYRSTKAALNAITKSMAIDLKAQGIKVVVLHPGWAQTDMGGPQATLAAADSVKSIRKVLSNLRPADSGYFIRYDGSQLTW
jgi:NAD(P)-dependent dehydrogenase (short-subunit alcohol dehydrogenase family)